MANYGLPPGPLSAYLGVRDANQRSGLVDTQNAQGLMGILAQAQNQRRLQQAEQEDQQIKSILSQTGDKFEAAIPALAKIGPKGMAMAGQLTAMQQHLLAVKQATKLAEFNANLGQFQRPATPGIPSPSDELGGGPALPAQPGSFDTRGALEAKVKAGLLDPLAYQKELDAINTPKFAPSRSPGYFQNGQYIATPVAPTPEKPTQLDQYVAKRDTYPVGHPLRKVYDDAIKKLSTHAPAANMNTSIITEREESKAVGKFFGEQFANIQNAAIQSQAKVNTLNRMDQLLEGVETGRLTPLGTEIASVAQSLGIKIDKNLGNKQAAQALGNEIALQNRNPAGGAGMPGALSDKDREFLLQMVPGLAITSEGRKQIISAAKQLAKRDLEVARMARDYRKKHGTVDEGFYEEIAKHAESNPLFSAPARRASDKPGAVKTYNPETGKIE